MVSYHTAEMKYKNISQRAARYAQGKVFSGIEPLDARGSLETGFADGYRLAMKELRNILNSDDAGFGGDHLCRTLENFVNDTERLK